MKKGIFMTEEEYNDLISEMNRYRHLLDKADCEICMLEDKTKRLWNEANMPAIESLQKQHDEEYLAWCEEISKKYEEADYLAWCEETAKKYDDMHWAKIWNCDTEDLKWIAWAKEYSREAIRNGEEERALYDWGLVCKYHFSVDREKRMAYKALYNYYYFYSYSHHDPDEWWFEQYQWWLSI